MNCNDFSDFKRNTGGDRSRTSNRDFCPLDQMLDDIPSFDSIAGHVTQKAGHHALDQANSWLVHLKIAVMPSIAHAMELIDASQIASWESIHASVSRWSEGAVVCMRGESVTPRFQPPSQSWSQANFSEKTVFSEQNAHATLTTLPINPDRHCSLGGDRTPSRPSEFGRPTKQALETKQVRRP